MPSRGTLPPTQTKRQETSERIYRPMWTALRAKAGDSAEAQDLLDNQYAALSDRDKDAIEGILGGLNDYPNLLSAACLFRLLTHLFHYAGIHPEPTPCPTRLGRTNLTIVKK